MEKPNYEFMAFPIRLRLSCNSTVGQSALFFLAARAGIWQRNKNLHNLPPIPKITYWGHLLSDRWIIPVRTDVHVFSISAIFCGLFTYVPLGVPWWFPMDPMWWMLLMKGVNLKSPAGYSRSIQKAASSPIQCSLYTDRGRPREKWGDGIGFEALRQVIKSNTPTHQGMWFPQVPLADMLNFFL